MESAILQLVVVFGLAAVILTLLVGVPQFRDYQRRHRQVANQIAHYAHVVSQYRLSKMLAFIGIKLDDYITRLPIAAIQQHVINCHNCPNIGICDRCLRDGEYVSDMNFCPNFQSLMMYSRIMPSVEKHFS